MLEQIHPIPGASVWQYEHIHFRVDSLPGLVVWAAIGSQVEEMVFRDGAFSPAYAQGSQFSVQVDLRTKFSVLRAGGWGGNSIRIYSSEQGSVASELNVVTDSGMSVVLVNGDQVRI
jgi:hypothetical protein